MASNWIRPQWAGPGVLGGIVEDNRGKDPPTEPIRSTRPPQEPHPSSTMAGDGHAVTIAGDGGVATAGPVDRTQVDRLVIAFYREIMFDDLLGPIFGGVAEVDWGEHILKLIDYWCWIPVRDQGLFRRGHEDAPPPPRPSADRARALRPLVLPVGALRRRGLGRPVRRAGQGPRDVAHGRNGQAGLRFTWAAPVVASASARSAVAP